MQVIAKQQVPVRGFWQKIIDNKLLKGKKIFVVAPMADVTDAAFRIMIAKYSRMGQKGGGPDVMWNEFVSCDGLAHPEGREKLIRDLAYTPEERPIIAQLFTANPDNMYKAAVLCRELGYDGIDINMGCPVNTINDQGAGAALIQTPELAIELIEAAKRGALHIPVSVKTRIGYNQIDWKPWLKTILSCNIAALTVHLRTRKEMSLVPAHWELMSEIVRFVREETGELIEGGTIIIGNGDVNNINEGNKLAIESGADGVMIGRGIFGTPWAFDSNNPIYTVEDKLRICLEHSDLYENTVGKYKAFAIMKKHYKAYVNGFNGAKELRERMFACNNAKEVKEVLWGFLEDQSKIAK